MSINVTPAFQVKYQNNVDLILQKQKCQLEEAVVWQDDASAEKIKVKDLIGNMRPLEADERHGDTKYNDPTYDGVWLAKPNELYYSVLIDNADRLATSIDLQGTSTMSGAGTINRAKDQRALEGFYNPIISGKDGTVSTPFPTSQVLEATIGGTGSAVKMNTAKLRAANKKLLQQYVDPMAKRWMILTADDNDALLTEVPATSADFKASYGGRVENGHLKELLGWCFIHMELDNPALESIPDLATDANGRRKTPFWVQGGIVGNFWQRSRASVDVVPTKLNGVQVFAGTTVGATRTQPGMCGVILNEKG